MERRISWDSLAPASDSPTVSEVEGISASKTLNPTRHARPFVRSSTCQHCTELTKSKMLVGPPSTTLSTILSTTLSTIISHDSGHDTIHDSSHDATTLTLHSPFWLCPRHQCRGYRGNYRGGVVGATIGATMPSTIPTTFFHAIVENSVSTSAP